MQTKEFIHAELRKRIPKEQPVPPFTAKEVIICELIDRMEKRLSDAHTKIKRLESEEE